MSAQKSLYPFKKYHSAVRFLHGLVKIPQRKNCTHTTDHADIYIKRMRYLLGLIGNPEKKMQYIHIGGTSGKGTVTHMLHEILYFSGATVGSFTSPSVTTEIEKIKVNDVYIAPDEFAKIVSYLKPFIDKATSDGPYGKPSMFEISLATAFVYFQRQHCEWVILEVGLGGRYDATNVIKNPIVTAITNIDYDHTELLGKTLQKIAYDKAGILKPGSTAFTTERRSSLLKIFSKICVENQIPLHILPLQLNYHESNVALTRAIAQFLNIPDEYIKQGIRHTRLPCRFEVMQKAPLIILDGAHNRSKIRATIENIERLNFNKLYLVVGIADNKDHISILRQIIPRADHVFFTKFQNKDRVCAPPHKLLKKSMRYLAQKTQFETHLDSEHALMRARYLASDRDLILVVGSFFLVGELRVLWFSEDTILTQRKSF